MADLGADGADTLAVDHSARVAVVPVLVDEVFLRHRERTETIRQFIFLRRRRGVLAVALLRRPTFLLVDA